MRILYVITGLKNAGAEKQLFLLVKSLHRKHNIKIISFTKGFYEKKFRELGIKPNVLNINNVFDAYLAYKGLVNEIDSFNPDIVHSWLPHANVMCKIVKFFSKDKFKLICGVRVTERKLWHLNLLEWLTKSQADCTVTNSKTIQNFLERRGFKNVRTIFNAY